ncbi:MAG: LamG domain-containing protein [Limisphaerales bacterium]
MKTKSTLLLIIFCFLAPLSVGFSQSFLTNGLVTYYPLQGNGNDQSGNHFDLNCTDVTFASGLGTNVAAFFSGTASSLCVVSNSFFGWQTNWTWSAWIYVPLSEESSVQALYHEGTTGAYFGLNVYPAANILRVISWNPATTSIWAYVNVPAPMQGQWTDVALTFAATNLNTGVLNVFLNGTLTKTTEFPVAAQPAAVPAVAVLGNGWGFGQSDYRTMPFRGGINNVRFYNRALSAPEVQQLHTYESVSQPDPLMNGLVAYYPFNGSAHDESWNHNDGIVSNALLAADRFGVANSAYSFDGKSSYIKFPSIPALKIRTNLTVALWIKRLNSSAAVLVKGNNLENAYSISLDMDGSVSFSHQDFRVVNHTSFSPAGTWFYAVWTVSAQSAKLYVNGALVDEGAGEEFYTGDGELFLGAFNDPPVGWFYSGSLDEIRIYNRVLSADEALRLYSIESSAGSGSSVVLIKALKPSFYNLIPTRSYQLQISSDMSTWTNHGSPFTATSTSTVYPQYFDVDNWGGLFFRLQVVP